jgi:hypothetical protein
MKALAIISISWIWFMGVFAIVALIAALANWIFN